MGFVVGIDGGGTKTSVLCCNKDGEKIAATKFGPFNLNSIGEEAFTYLLKEICLYIEHEKEAHGECEALCIGAAGISNTRMQELVSSSMNKHKITNWKLVGDHEIALCGALDGKSGIGVIAGTGSICFGCDGNGLYERAGGWGHLIGDAGSGYALGRDALVAITKAYDGYGKHSEISDMLSSEMQLSTRAQIISYVYSNDKSAISALAPIVEKACSLGDTVAKEIITKNACALAYMVETVAKKLSLSKTNVAMLGGLLSNQTNLRATFIEKMHEIDPDKSCIDPLHNAATGAIMMALEMVK